MSDMLKSHISTSTPLAILPLFNLQDAQTFGFLTPPQIASVYNIPTNLGAGVTVGIISLGGGFSQTDINLACADFGLTAPNIHVKSVNGYTNPGLTGAGFDIENTLDIYCVGTIVPNATINMYMTNNGSATGMINAVTQAVNDNCDVISISYGSLESSDYLGSILATAIAKGITVFAGSGDSGNVAPNTTIEDPSYPASSPYIMAVGGSLLSVTNNTRASEYPTWASGGGISQIMSLPTFQTGLHYTPYNPSTGTSGSAATLPRRGTPDLVAPFHNYAMYFNGNVVGPVSGTSAACPVMAGIIARFISLSGGIRPQQGAFSLNSVFYKHYNAFYNTGFNQVYNGSGISNNDAYSSAAGAYTAVAGEWDPISGLGAPNGPSMYRMFEAMANTVMYPFANRQVRPRSGQTYPRRSARADVS